MITNLPDFDIQIGDVRFSTTPLLNKQGSMLELVQSVVINKNLDKTAAKGKRKVKINTCDVVIANTDHQLDNILRLGRKVKVWLGFEGAPLVRVGVYTLCNPKWKYPKNGVPTVHFKAKAGDVGLMMDGAGFIMKNMSHTQAIKELAVKYGFLVDIPVDSKEKTTLLKTVHEYPLDAMQRWAYDIGFDFFVDDETEPNTVVCKPVNDRDFTTFGASQLGGNSGSRFSNKAQIFTTGWGPGTPAAFPASEMEIEHNYPDPTTSAMGRKENGAVVGTGELSAVLLGFVKAGLLQKGQADNVINTMNRSTTTPSQVISKMQGAQAAQKLSKVVTCTYDPGIPFFRLGQAIRLVGHGDHSRVYRLVDITHSVGKTGYKTTIKAIIGGDVTAKSTAGTFIVGGTGEKSAVNFGSMKQTPKATVQ